MDRSFLRRFHASNMFHRIRVEPGVSQRGIIEKTGFDKSTVSSIVNQFVAQGLVERRGKVSESGRGRPSDELYISPTAGIIVGVEVESAKIRFVACGLDGSVHAQTAIAYDGGPDGVEHLIAEGGRQVVQAAGVDARVIAMGVSLPGLIKKTGVIVHVPVLGWRDVDILSRLRSVLDWPIFVGNDGKAAAMAEHMFGSCVNIENFIYVLFSDGGVGGGLFLDGSPHTGSDGLAGELGHIKIVPQGRFCTCGAAGCLSAYLSAPALIEEISRLGPARPRSYEDNIELAQQGDPIVLNVLEHAGDVLGSAVSSLINIFNPPVVVLGGHIGPAAPFLSAALDRALQRLAHPAMYARTSIRFAESVVGTPPLGAVALALDGVTDIVGTDVLP